MAFRDDREALRDRADALERELAEARAEIEILRANIQPNSPERSALLGGPLWVELVRDMDGTISDESKELIIEELRRRFGAKGTLSTAGRSFVWSLVPSRLKPSREITVNVRSRNNRTTISVIERNETLASGLFASFCLGLGVGPGALIAVLIAKILGTASVVGFLIVWFLLLYLLARASFATTTRARRADAQAALDAVVSIAREELEPAGSAVGAQRSSNERVRVEGHAQGAQPSFDDSSESAREVAPDDPRSGKLSRS